MGNKNHSDRTKRKSYTFPLIFSILSLLFQMFPLSLLSGEPEDFPIPGEIPSISIQISNNISVTLRKELFNCITPNKIETLLRKRYAFFLSGISQPTERRKSKIKILISRNTSGNSANSPIIYATTLLNYQTDSSTFIPLRSKISVKKTSYKALLPGIANEIAYMIAKVNNFKTNTEILPPTLETYITAEQLKDITKIFTHTNNRIEIYSLTPYLLRQGNREPIRGITLLTNIGFISLDPEFNPNEITVRDLAFQQFHPITNDNFDTLFTNNFNNLYLLSTYTGKLKEVEFDSNTLKEKTIPLSANSTLLKLGESMFILIEQSPNPIVGLYSNNLSEKKIVKLFSLPIYSNFFSAASIKTNSPIRNSLLYLFDALERRIRVINSTGKEIDTIKPIYNPQIMPMPNGMEILHDGSFILSGSGTIMEFDRYGLPLWKIDSYRIKYPTSFPPATKVAVIEEKESIYVVDNQTSTVLKYSYNPEKISKPEKPIKANPAITPIGLANLFEKLAAEKENQLIYPAALEYYNQAITIYRKLRLQHPLEVNYSTHLLKLTEERNRILNAMAKRNILEVTLKEKILHLTQQDLTQQEITLIAKIKNLEDSPLSNIKLKINIPYLAINPKELTIKQLKENQSKIITTSLKLNRDMYNMINSIGKTSWKIYIRANCTTTKNSQELLFSLPLVLLPLKN